MGRCEGFHSRRLLEAESSAKHARNVRLKTQWAHFPYNKGLEQFDFSFQPSIDERKLRVANQIITP
jgi:DNA replication protein DnaC